MNISFIKGSFETRELEDLLANLYKIKIKFHEDKIMKTDDMEMIKMREKRIIDLQRDLNRIKELLSKSDGRIDVESQINLSHGGK